MTAEATTEEIEKAETETPAGEPAIIVRRAFEATPAHVFAAWTDPDVIGAWWGPNGFKTTTRSFDFQEGGTWDFTMHGPDDTDYPNFIRYVQIVTPERIVYDHRSSAAHPGGFRNTVMFAPCEEGTRLTMEMRFPDMRERDRTVRAGAVQGGKQTLARLGEHLQRTTVAAGVTTASAPPDSPAITIRRMLDAPPALVFAAFADPQQVDQWWGPDGFRNTTHEHDFRPGGAWRYMMHGPDGTDYPNKSVFVEIVPPERIVFDQGWDSAVFKPMFRTEITFRAIGDKTEIALKQVYPSAAERDGNLKRVDAIKGGKQTLARLAAFVEVRA